MTAQWTSEQVLALSPDAGSTKRGKALATVSKWPLLGRSQQAVWGECKGSGSKPYRTIIDLGTGSEEPAFRCSCPSRKFPCKHALGLFLLLAEQTSAEQNSAEQNSAEQNSAEQNSSKTDFNQADVPDWGAEWLEKRAQSASQKQEKKKRESSDPATQAKRTAQTAAKRAAKVEAGLADLDQWMQDIIRQGLVNLPGQPYRFWDQAAARLVDAQAPGLARRVRAMAGIPHSGEHWPEKMLKALGKLNLLVRGYSQLSLLAPEMQAEVRSQIGWLQTKDDLIQRAKQGDPLVPCVKDTWQVLGKVVTEEENLKVQRVWLWGIHLQKAALILSFAHGRQPLDVSLVPGMAFKGELIFYPGTGQQGAGQNGAGPDDDDRNGTSYRALILSRQTTDKSTWKDIGAKNIDCAIAQYAQSLTQNPWLEEFPMALKTSLLRYENHQWWVQDNTGQVLPVSSGFKQGWELLAMSGGHPLTLFGEWNGESLLPLSVWSNKKFMALGS